MKLTKRQQRSVRKLILPLVAIAMMATVMSMEASRRSSTQTSLSPGHGAAARVNHALRHR
jgi:hypothetical protein